MYGSNSARELKLFDRDDHALTRNSLETEQLIGGFILKCAGLDSRADADGLSEKLVGDDEKLALMKKGGDLRRNESVE
jgi:hypothetical protein